MNNDDAVAAARKPLEQYIKGHQTRQSTDMRAAFLPAAHVEGMRAEGFVSWDVDTYCGLFDGIPAVDEQTRSRTIELLEVHESVALARMTLIHGATKSQTCLCC